MSEIKYRAVKDGKMVPQPGGPTTNVRSGDVLILTAAQYAANSELFERVKEPKDDKVKADEPVKAEVKPAPKAPEPSPAPISGFEARKRAEAGQDAKAAAEKPKGTAFQGVHRK